MGPLKVGRQKRNVRLYAKMPDNSAYSPSTSLAYLILAGTSGWALRHCSISDTPWAFGTFSFLLGHSIVSFINFSSPSEFPYVKEVFEQCSLIAEVLPLPVMNMELYMMHGFDLKFACLHVVPAVLPLGTQFVIEEHNDKVIDVALLGNIISLVYLTVTHDCPWAGGLAALACINHYVFRRIAERLEVPKMDIAAIGMSFFNIFAVNCLCESSSG